MKILRLFTRWSCFRELPWSFSQRRQTLVHHQEHIRLRRRSDVNPKPPLRATQTGSSSRYASTRGASWAYQIILWTPRKYYRRPGWQATPCAWYERLLYGSPRHLGRHLWVRERSSMLAWLLVRWSLPRLAWLSLRNPFEGTLRQSVEQPL